MSFRWSISPWAEDVCIPRFIFWRCNTINECTDLALWSLDCNVSSWYRSTQNTRRQLSLTLGALPLKPQSWRALGNFPSLSQVYDTWLYDNLLIEIIETIWINGSICAYHDLQSIYKYIYLGYGDNAERRLFTAASFRLFIIDDLTADQPRQQHQTSRRSRWGSLEDYTTVLLLSFRYIRLYNNFHGFVVDRTKSKLCASLPCTAKTTAKRRATIEIQTEGKQLEL